MSNKPREMITLARLQCFGPDCAAVSRAQATPREDSARDVPRCAVRVANEMVAVSVRVAPLVCQPEVNVPAERPL